MGKHTIKSSVRFVLSGPKMMLLALCLGLASANTIQHRPKAAEVNMTAEAAASCDPDYGWINGPDGTNKCYMVLKETAYAQCFPEGGGGGDYTCDPSNPNCYNECYNTQCCYDYSCGGGSYYTSFNWFEAMQCCVANHGYLAEPSSQEEHDLIKERLAMLDGDVHTGYWLGASDFYAEGEWQWATGAPVSFTQWHEGEPNDVDNEDCLSMSSQDGYEWQDLGCDTRNHAEVYHYAVCQNNKG